MSQAGIQMEMFMSAETNTRAAGETASTADGATPASPDASNGDKQSRKPRGRGIIYFGLREADEALRKIDQAAKRMSRNGFAIALGHKKPENRFGEKVAALKTFALVEEDGDDIRLTDLAVDMLYAGSETARNQARVKAFQSYLDFQRTFIECPKNQDHPLTYVREFVTGKLGIINEADRFLRLFLESAHFAGLMEGELNVKAERVRFRPGVIAESKSNGRGTRPENSRGQEQPLDGSEAVKVLEEYGLADFQGRVEVFRTSSGQVKTTTEPGTITVEINCPMKLRVQSDNAIEDLVKILQEFKARGFHA